MAVSAGSDDVPALPCLPSQQLALSLADYNIMLVNAHASLLGPVPPSVGQACPVRMRCHYSPALHSLSVHAELTCPAFSVTLKPVMPVPVSPSALCMRMFDRMDGNPLVGVLALTSVRKLQLLPTSAAHTAPLIGVYERGELQEVRVRGGAS